MASLKINVLLLLDPVRPESNGFDAPKDRKGFKPLPNVEKGVSFFSATSVWPRGNCFDSRPDDEGFHNVPLRAAHSKILVHPRVKEFLVAQIIELTA